jgi:hypothetical protein
MIDDHHQFLYRIKKVTQVHTLNNNIFDIKNIPFRTTSTLVKDSSSAMTCKDKDK